MLNQFKGKQFSNEIIILCVRWYLKYNFSYRDLQEMMQERGIEISHTTIYRWVIEYTVVMQKLHLQLNMRYYRHTYQLEIYYETK